MVDPAQCDHYVLHADICLKKLYRVYCYLVSGREDYWVCAVTLNSQVCASLA